MGYSVELETELRRTFSPVLLEVINESHLHAGHGHHDGTGESHLRIKIVSDAFTAMTRVERHRAINAVAAKAIAAGLHALAIDAKTPQEAAI